MPDEAIVRTVDGRGVVTAITNGRESGWQVAVYRPDGTSDSKSVGSKAAAHQVISEMRDGYFKVSDPEPEEPAAKPVRTRRAR